MNDRQTQHASRCEQGVSSLLDLALLLVLSSGLVLRWRSRPSPGIQSEGRLSGPVRPIYHRPTNAFADSNAPVVIGVLGADPFGDVLDKTVKAEKGRPLVVRRVDNVTDAARCM